MTSITMKGVRKSFGPVDVIKGVDLEVKTGEFMVFVGPSGCGKSTLLRLIAGLEDITSGTMSFDDKVVNALTPSNRGIAMVFQSYALYPHMTVYDNMAFGLKLNGRTPEQIRASVEKAAELLQISQYLDRLPKQLSGGQRQRVAIGRAIVRDPKVFLFDEPLSNLDAALRVATRIEIAKLHHDMNKTTMIYVTHDQVEAMTLADRIAVMRAGVIQQIGTPDEIYKRPVNLFVAGFLGSPTMNTLSGRLVQRDGRVFFEGPAAQVDLTGYPFVAAPAVGSEVVLGIRPEQLVVAEGGPVTGTVSLVEPLGPNKFVWLEVPGGGSLSAVVDAQWHGDLGQRIAFDLDVPRASLFDAKSQNRL